MFFIYSNVNIEVQKYKDFGNIKKKFCQFAQLS